MYKKIFRGSRPPDLPRRKGRHLFEPTPCPCQTLVPIRFFQAGYGPACKRRCLTEVNARTTSQSKRMNATESQSIHGMH